MAILARSSSRIFAVTMAAFCVVSHQLWLGLRLFNSTFDSYLHLSLSTLVLNIRD